MERRVAAQQLRSMVEWAESGTCRRQALLAYFDEPFDGQPAPCCDVCDQPAAEEDWTTPAQMFLSCVKRTRERFGAAHVIDVLRGSRNERLLRFGHDTLSTYGIGRDRPKEDWQYLARELVRGGYAHRDEDEFNALKVTERGYAVLFHGEKVMLRPAPHVAARQAAAPAAAHGASLPQPHAALFDRLRALRKRLADERGLPPYTVFHDATLRQMAAQLPATHEQLRRVQGVGERKLLDFGDTFLAAIAEFARETGAEPLTAPQPAPAARAAPRRDGKLAPTAEETLDLVRAGHGLEEIATRRGLALRTVEDHLAEAVEAGAEVDLDRLVAPEKRSAIEAAIAQIGPAFLKPIMDHLGDGFTYGEIKLVRASLNARGQGSEAGRSSTRLQVSQAG
jgi:ATP-dependent DNA helicase RecQ